MNKYIKLTIILILLVIVGTLGYNILNPNIEKMPYEIINDKTGISRIATDSFLDILIETKNYSSDEINYEDMLKAAMRISRELDLLEEMSTETNFYEYVPETTIHSMISELTGKSISSPIIIEDFYYLYNSEGKYYYIVPVGTDWIHINQIKEVKSIDDGAYYIITCSTSFSEDGITSDDYGDIEITLKHCPNNKYIRYQLISMKLTEATTI